MHSEGLSRRKIIRNRTRNLPACSAVQIRRVHYRLLLADRLPWKSDYLCCVLCELAPPYSNMPKDYAASSVAHDMELLEKIECRALVVSGYREVNSGYTRYSRLSKHRPMQCKNKHSITFFVLPAQDTQIVMTRLSSTYFWKRFCDKKLSLL